MFCPFLEDQNYTFNPSYFPGSGQLDSTLSAVNYASLEGQADTIHSTPYLEYVDIDGSLLAIIWNDIYSISRDGKSIKHICCNSGLKTVNIIPGTLFLVLGYEDGTITVSHLKTPEIIMLVSRVSDKVENKVVSRDNSRLVVNGNYIFRLTWEYNFS
jgi:hypothetical protein